MINTTVLAANYRSVVRAPLSCLLVALTAFSSACATRSVQTAPAPAPAQLEVPTATTESESPVKRIDASSKLRDQANASIEAGNFSQAKRLLDRALRIDARDPETWYDYARLSNLQGDQARAQQMIKKSLRLNPTTDQRERLLKLESEISQTSGSPES